MQMLQHRSAGVACRNISVQPRLLVPVNCPSRAEQSIACAALSVTEKAAPAQSVAISPTDSVDEINQHIREGHYEHSLVHLQVRLHKLIFVSLSFLPRSPGSIAFSSSHQNNHKVGLAF